MALLPERYFRRKKKQKVKKPNPFQRFYNSFVKVFTFCIIANKTSKEECKVIENDKEESQEDVVSSHVDSHVEISSVSSYESDSDSDLENSFHVDESTAKDQEQSCTDMNEVTKKSACKALNLTSKPTYVVEFPMFDAYFRLEELDDADEKMLSHWMNYKVFDDVERSEYESVYGVFPSPPPDWSDEPKISRYCKWAYTPQENMEIFEQMPFFYCTYSFSENLDELSICCSDTEGDYNEHDFGLQILYQEEEPDSCPPYQKERTATTINKSDSKLELDIGEILGNIFDDVEKDKYRKVEEKNNSHFNTCSHRNESLKTDTCNQQADSLKTEFNHEEFLALEEEILSESLAKNSCNNENISDELKMLEEEIFQSFCAEHKDLTGDLPY